MSRLELLATLVLGDEPGFELLLKKFSDLPRLLKERELNLLPLLMLATDVLRVLRADGDDQAGSGEPALHQGRAEGGHGVVGERERGAGDRPGRQHRRNCGLS